MKGQVQFNWIFIIIAGALILAFFVTFATRYIDLQNQMLSASIGRGLDDQLDSLRTTSSFQPIDLGVDIKLSNDCKIFSIGTYNSVDSSNKLIFMPKNFRAVQLQAWIQPWQFPYTIDNFYYLSSNNIKYYLLYDSQSQDIVNQLLNSETGVPRLFNIESTTDVNKIIKDIGKYQEVKVISFIGKQKIPGNITFVEVNDNNGNGIATINSKQYAYFGLPMLYGAIFGDNYDCMLNNAINKMDEVTQVYSNKALYLWRANTNNACNYALVKNSLDKLRIEIKAVPINPSDVLTSISSIESQNKALDSQGCVTVY